MILGLELTDFWGRSTAFRDPAPDVASRLRPGTRLISITATDLYTKSNYQDFQRYPEVDIAMAADAEATLPALIEAVRKLVTADRRARSTSAGKASRKRTPGARSERPKRPTPGMLAHQHGAAGRRNLGADQDRRLVAGFRSGNSSGWAVHLWNFDKPYHYLGDSGGAGVGYGAPAAVGAALANKKHGRLSVNIQSDGDMLYAPGVLWTAAHHRIPLLTVMHNNRAYHQEVMHIQRMANRHKRGITRQSARRSTTRTSTTRRSRRAWASRRGADQEPPPISAGAPPRPRGRQEGRAGACRCRDAAAIAPQW